MRQSFNVKGMRCAGCASKVAAVLSSIPGVRDARVDVAHSLVELEAQAAISYDVLRPALAAAGPFEIVARTDIASTRPNAGSRRLLPLFAMLTLVAVFALLRNLPPAATAHWGHELMLDYMAGFFLLFGGLKLVNLRRFSAMFAQYDPLAGLLPAWGLLYPFVELTLGAAYLFRVGLDLANFATIVLLGIGMVGIWRKLRSKTEIMCACLGGVFSVPVTWLTFGENAAMVLMAAMAITG